MAALNEQLNVHVAVLIGSKELRKETALQWKNSGMSSRNSPGQGQRIGFHATHRV